MNRMSPGEHRAAVGHDDDHVPSRVRRPDLDQLDLTPSDIERQAAVERPRRRRRLDAIEVERAEEAAEQVTDLTRRGGQPAQQCRRNLLHLGGGRGGRHDLGVGDELVAVAVVPVGVGVHDGRDRRGPGVRREGRQHRRRQPEIEQRVDEQRDAVADDQAGVAPSPRAVALDVGEAAFAGSVHGAVDFCRDMPSMPTTAPSGRIASGSIREP